MERRATDGSPRRRTSRVSSGEFIRAGRGAADRPKRTAFSPSPAAVCRGGGPGVGGPLRRRRLVVVLLLIAPHPEAIHSFPEARSANRPPLAILPGSA